jgi:hypothetical protein
VPARRARQRVEDRAQLAERVAAGLFDRAQRGACLLGALVDQVQRRAAQDPHHPAHTAPLYTPGGLTRVLTVLGFAFLLSTIFDASISSGEFRHCTANVTYLAFPDRDRVLIAKLIVAAASDCCSGRSGSLPPPPWR